MTNCKHEFITYTGLNETFEYCKNCDGKRSALEGGGGGGGSSPGVAVGSSPVTPGWAPPSGLFISRMLQEPLDNVVQRVNVLDDIYKWISEFVMPEAQNEPYHGGGTIVS